MLMRAPTSALTSVDLPTLGRPTTATWPQRKLAAAAGSGACCLLIGLGGGGLLSSATAAAGALPDNAQRRNATRDFERLRMSLAAHFDDRVVRHRETFALQELLQSRLRVLGHTCGIDAVELSRIHALDR